MPIATAIARRIFHSAGGLRVVRLANRRKIRIVMYHRFPADTTALREQCAHLRRHYTPVTMSQVSASLHEGDPLPPNAAAVTVDDGFRDFLTNGQPVFRDYGIAPTVYLVTGFVDGDLWPWFSQVHWAYEHSSRAGLGSKAERTAAARQLVESLKESGNEERVRAMDCLGADLEIAIPAVAPAEYAALSWDEVRDLAREGVEFGAHTHTHPVLSRIAAEAEVAAEITRSRDRIATELGRGVLHFCYPNGRLQDIGPAALAKVKEAGFQTAVTTERGCNGRESDPFVLRRLGIDPAEDLRYYFRELMAGVRNT